MLFRSPQTKKTLVYNSGITRGLHAQRLVKTLCQECAIPLKTNKNVIPLPVLARLSKAMGQAIETAKVVNEKGCPKCQHTGIKGRTVVAEVVVATFDLLELARTEGSHAAKAEWIRQGGKTMMAHGLEKVAQGLIDPLMLEAELEQVIG